MSGKTDHKTVLKSLDKIQIKAKLTRRDLTRLRKVFGARFTEAIKLLKERRVKKYVFKPSGKVIWIVVGREHDYIIYPDAPYCHCEDFYFHIMEGKAYACQHLIARKLAETLNMYDMVEENNEHFDALMNEWRAVKSARGSPGREIG